MTIYYSEQLQSICQRIIETTSSYSITPRANSFESMIREETSNFPESISLSKRVQAIAKNDPCICKHCGIVHGRTEITFCSPKCSNQYHSNPILTPEEQHQVNISKAIKKGEQKFKDKKEGFDYLVCQICGCKTAGLASHLKFHPEISVDEYKERYEMRTLKTEYQLEMMISENNPFRGHGGKYSAWSEKFIHGYDEKRHEQFKKDHSDRMKTLERKQNNVFCREYYETEEDFIRHQSKNLDFFVSKYGDEEGKKRYLMKTERWLKTLNSKSDEEKLEMNRKKIWRNGSKSKLEQTVFNQILSKIDGLNQQFYLKRNNIQGYLYDIQKDNKIIEFNGDYWHANPLLYDENDVGFYSNLTASQIWEKDRIKINCAESQGYEVLTIWESEYKQNPQETIEKCINYLTQ